ncbi:MAG: class I SAM-dependent methyltransferase [Candidatus Eisenbacteria bacterium]|nr:class I SAM-dependent methyltransferase [Candidatus Eisenbacteria bacterium]
MPTKSAHGLVREMRGYYAAHAPWHDECMSYTDNALMELLLHPIVERVGEMMAGLNVLEIACGTGNWTQVLSRRANGVVAIDSSPEALSIAETKEYGQGEVEFRLADAYRLSDLDRRFTGAFAADWWSHVPKSLLAAFLSGLGSCLSEGAPVVFVDMLPRPHPDLEPYRHDAEGNAICRRTLPDGRSFDVVKNFPDRQEVLESVAHVGTNPRFWAWDGLRRWMVAYSAAAHRG